MQYPCIDVKKLSAEAINEIQSLIGSDVVNLIAFDAEGNPYHLTRDEVEVVHEDLFEIPMKLERIPVVKSITSQCFQIAPHLCRCCYYWGTERICYDYPC